MPGACFCPGSCPRIQFESANIAPPFWSPPPYPNSCFPFSLDLPTISSLDDGHDLSTGLESILTQSCPPLSFFCSLGDSHPTLSHPFKVPNGATLCLFLLAGHLSLGRAAVSLSSTVCWSCFSSGTLCPRQFFLTPSPAVLSW